MYYYSIGYLNKESSADFMLVSGRGYTEEEFDSLVADAAEGAVMNWLETEQVDEVSVSDHYWLSPLCRDDVIHAFSSLVPSIVCWLVEEKGFSVIEPGVAVVFDGGSRVLPKLDGSELSRNNPHNMMVSDRVSIMVDKIMAKNASVQGLPHDNPDEDELPGRDIYCEEDYDQSLW